MASAGDCEGGVDGEVLEAGCTAGAAAKVCWCAGCVGGRPLLRLGGLLLLLLLLLLLPMRTALLSAGKTAAELLLGAASAALDTIGRV
jgi:hypothetical protein